MGELAEALERDVVAATGDKATWREVCDSMKDGGLESALTATAVSDSLKEQIVRATQRLIAEEDRKIYLDIVAKGRQLALTRLLAHLFNATERTINVVTTNYDCLIEYAAESAGFNCCTGFRGTYVRRRMGPSVVPLPQASRGSGLRLSKVHGSIDWFRGQDNIVKALSCAVGPPQSLVPMIVTPGIEKYQQTHQEPFRTVLQTSDASVRAAKTAICIGYGFNDEHIHPVIHELVQGGQMSLIIVARNLTPAAQAVVGSCGPGQVVTIERGECDRDAQVSWGSGRELQVSKPLWELPYFVDEFLS